MDELGEENETDKDVVGESEGEASEEDLGVAGKAISGHTQEPCRRRPFSSKRATFAAAMRVFRSSDKSHNLTVT